MFELFWSAAAEGGRCFIKAYRRRRFGICKIVRKYPTGLAYTKAASPVGLDKAPASLCRRTPKKLKHPSEGKDLTPES